MLTLLVIINLTLLAWIIFQNRDLILSFRKRSGRMGNDDYSFEKTVSKEIKSIQVELKSLRNDLTKTQKNQKSVVLQIQDYLNKLYKDVRGLSKKVSDVEKKVVKKEKTPVDDSIDEGAKMVDAPVQFEIQIPEKLNSPIYLKNFRDNILMECREEDAQFKTTEISDGQALFCFCGDVATAIATKDATFSGVCELVGWYNEAHSLSMIDNGIIKQYSEGKWEVVKLAKIKFD